MFNGFCYIIIAEKRTLVDDPDGIYIRPVNEHVIMLRRQRRLHSHINWHGDILVAKCDVFTGEYMDIDGADVPFIYNILVRPKLDTLSDVESLVQEAKEAAESASEARMGETISDIGITAES